jgi:hypothetical protein
MQEKPNCPMRSIIRYFRRSLGFSVSSRRWRCTPFSLPSKPLLLFDFNSNGQHDRLQPPGPTGGSTPNRDGDRPDYPSAGGPHTDRIFRAWPDLWLPWYCHRSPLELGAPARAHHKDSTPSNRRNRLNLSKANAFVNKSAGFREPDTLARTTSLLASH